MKSIISGVLLALSAALLLGAQGTVPAREVTSYPANIVVEGAGLGAIALRDFEVKQRFVSDVGHDFLIVEVALYPAKGAKFEVQPERFGLQTGKDQISRPENPKVIAAYIQKAEAAKRDIVVVPQVGVGYESGNRTVYDPVTGTHRRQGGVYTSTGVMVGVEPSGGANPKNEDTIALELTEKGLPKGSFDKPVSGYLYFKIDKKAVKEGSSNLSLVCEIMGKDVTLPLSR